MKKLIIIVVMLVFCNTVSASITAHKIADPKLVSSPHLENNEYGFYGFSQLIDVVNTNWIAISNSPTEVSLEIDDYAVLTTVNPNPIAQIYRLNDDGNQAIIYGRYTPNGEVGEWTNFDQNGNYTFLLEVWNREGVGQHDTLWLLIDESLNGDFNQDGKLDVVDIDFLTNSLANNETTTAMDTNRDGAVTNADRSYLLEAALGTNFGDANLDGAFDSQDMILALSAGKYEMDSLASWSEGDFSGDQLFNTQDMIMALQTGAYETPLPGLSIPEPANAALYFVLLICCWKARAST